MIASPKSKVRVPRSKVQSPKSKVQGPRSGPVRTPQNSRHATRNTQHALAAQLPVIPDAPDASDIRDIKPPVELPNEWLWLWIALAIVLVAAVAVTVWWLARKKALVPPPVPVIPPHVRAKQRLAEALMFISDPDKFCTAVSNTARLYLEERFTLRAPERTTEEFLVELSGSPHLTIDQKQSLGAFLESCDLVKFARFEPTETALRQLHDAALRLVDETQFDPINTATPLAGATMADRRPPIAKRDA